MVNKNSKNIETEAVLVIISDEPEVLAKKISALTSIADYTLQPEPVQIIHDIYYDTPDKKLGLKMFALRIREVDNRYLVTLKGPSSYNGRTGGTERFELEDTWSGDVMKLIQTKLSQQGIELPKYRSEFEHSSPVEVMNLLELEVVQDRKTVREILNIKSQVNEKEVPAVLTVDKVSYKFQNKEIIHHEIEIESKSADGPVVIKKVMNNLVEMYKPHLQEWAFSKMAIGKALEKIIDEDDIERYIDDNNHLKPDSYSIIEAHLIDSGT